MKEFARTRWYLAIVLTVFVVCKLPHLDLAFYWDESWPYAAAIKTMYRDGISILPDALDPELSKGHPLLFHAAAASWMKLFGPSNIAVHSFALFVSMLCLTAVYEAALRLFNIRVAILAVTMLATQVIFFVQAAFLLPEVFIALLALWSIYYYVRGNYGATALLLTLLFLSKESGLVLGCILGVDGIVSIISNKNSRRASLYKIASVIVPCLIIAGFFFIQKLQRGWFLYPEHIGYMHLQWDHFYYDFKVSVLYSLFCGDTRYYLFIVLLILSLAAAIKNKSPKYFVPGIPAFFIYYLVDDMRSGRLLPGIPFFILFVIALCFTLYVLVKKKIIDTPVQARFIVLSWAFMFLFCCFSALNFFTPRYIIIALAPLLLFAAAMTDKMVRLTYYSLFYPALIAIFITAFFAFRESTGRGDTNMGAFDGVAVQQKTVDFFEQHAYYDKQIAAGSFLNLAHLQHPECGFTRSGKGFKNTRWAIDSLTEFVVFDNVDPDYRYNEVLTGGQFKQVYRFQKDSLWCEIYQRR